MQQVGVVGVGEHEPALFQGELHAVDEIYAHRRGHADGGDDDDDQRERVVALALAQAAGLDEALLEQPPLAAAVDAPADIDHGHAGKGRGDVVRPGKAAQAVEGRVTRLREKEPERGVDEKGVDNAAEIGDQADPYARALRFPGGRI